MSSQEVGDLVSQFEAIAADAKALVEPLPEAVFNRQPASGGWSVGQCMEHLNITERAMLANMRPAAQAVQLSGTPASQPTRHGWLMGWFIGTMEPPVKRRIRTRSGFIPPATLVKDAVLGEFLRLHQEVLRMLREVDGRDLSAKVQSPFSRFLRYKLGSAFALMAAHDRRHLWQARQALAHAPAQGPAGGRR
ncbi:MAG TPA: DinB family protein [Gemmatimonadales bacterium]|nr:DinB family protein [Gemmatimonadales bacterium]